MRILLIAHGFPPQAAAGAELHVQALATAMARSKSSKELQVFVLARESDDKRKEFSVRKDPRHGFDVFYLNHTYGQCRSFEDTYNDDRICSRAAQLFDELRPDVAHIHHLTNLSIDLVPELAVRKIPIFFTLHDFWLMCQRGQLLDRDLKRCEGPSPAGCSRCLGLAGHASPVAYQAAKRLRQVETQLPPFAKHAVGQAKQSLANLSTSAPNFAVAERRLRQIRVICNDIESFIAPSETVRDKFLSFGVPPAKLFHLAYGHDHTPFANLKRTKGQRLRIGFLGSLMVSKAPHLLLQAFAQLPEGSATLDLYGTISDYHGDNSYPKRLQSLLQHPGITHHPNISHDNVPAVLAKIDLLVVPSIWLENAPLVISEAFMAGVPVLVSNLGGMAEMVKDGQGGLVFAAGDARDLQRRLERFLNEDGLIGQLRDSIPQVERVEETAETLVRHYQRAVMASRFPRSTTADNTGRKLVAVIVNYQTPALTLRAAQSLRASSRKVDAIIVVDNGSKDRSLKRLRADLPEATMISLPENRGFTGGSNEGIRRALNNSADQIVLLNSDAHLHADCLKELEDALWGDSQTGLVGPALLSAADPQVVESLGLHFSSRTGRFRNLHFGENIATHLNRAPEKVRGISGCVMLIRRQVFEEIGLFDEDYFLYFEDLDLCLRAERGGFECLSVAKAKAYHEGNASIGRRSTERLYYATRNHHLLASRSAQVSNPIHRVGRGATITALNIAHALLTDGSPRPSALRAVLRGIRDHGKGRYGAMKSKQIDVG